MMMNSNLPARADIETTAMNSGKYRVLRLHYTNASGEKGVTTFEYNQK
jgi:hypothetical protein